METLSIDHNLLPDPCKSPEYIDTSETSSEEEDD